MHDKKPYPISADRALTDYELGLIGKGYSAAERRIVEWLRKESPIRWSGNAYEMADAIERGDHR